MIYRKKLIEVALPLDVINTEAAREKSIRHGHPSTLHLWWARRPLAAARAVIFAQMVDDPSSVPEEFPTDATQESERKRLFDLLEKLVLWENTTNEQILNAARQEIRRSWERHLKDSGLPENTPLPPFHDPFAGGGAIPLEAQRLGFVSHASDLNPVAVMINKAMIEIPPRFAGHSPIGPKSEDQDSDDRTNDWRGATGLAEDVRRYGSWMRNEAEKLIGHLYPKVDVVRDTSGHFRHAAPVQSEKTTPPVEQRTVIAWLWARTIESPNPAYRGCHVPLVSSFWLSTKKGKETWVHPVVDGREYHFEVGYGVPTELEAVENGTKLGRGANFRCLFSGVPITPEYVKEEGIAGRLSARLLAIVADGDRSRIYLSPDEKHEKIALSARPDWRPEQSLPNDPRNFWTVSYGLNTYASLFTARQLLMLGTLSGLVSKVRERILSDSKRDAAPEEMLSLEAGGKGVAAYADAICIYLALAVSKLTDASSSLTRWKPSMDQSIGTFGRQALPMTWDYSEPNPFAQMAGDLKVTIGNMMRVLDQLTPSGEGLAYQGDASRLSTDRPEVISSDPPYYDNIGYADLSDYFYVWLRHSLRPLFPSLFSTLLVPKAEELVASPYRHGGKEKAEGFFLDGMTRALHGMAERAHPSIPVTIYYAFKQSETKESGGTSSTGWETFLEAVIRAGFAVTGTWPMRTEMGNRMIGVGTNALASSIVLVCRPRSTTARTISRRDFLTELKNELPLALRHLQRSNIAPVDLAQAAIGPGMAVYSRHAKVLEGDGKAMAVREALVLINQILSDVLAEQEGEFDASTRWALAWFEQYGAAEGPYGVAETLSKAKNTSVAGMVEDGVVSSSAGKVRLLRRDELPANWDPRTDKRLTDWETAQHLILALDSSGEAAAAALLAKLPGEKAEACRDLAYQLYALCEKKKWAQDAIAYNGLIIAWPELVKLAQAQPAPADDSGTPQSELGLN
jgi:putative DNA methylase